MSLISGPGRDGTVDGESQGTEAEMELKTKMMLYVDKHVEYIKSLDTVSSASSRFDLVHGFSAEMS